MVRLNLKCLWLAVAVLLATSSSNGQGVVPADSDVSDEPVAEFKYEPNPNRVQLKSLVNEVAIDRFMRGEPMVIIAPQSKQQIVSSVRLEKAESFKSEPLRLNLRSRLVGDSVAIALPVAAVERLDYQPVEILIYQSQLSNIKFFPDFAKDNDLQLKTRSIQPDFFVRLKPSNGVAVAFKLNKSFRLNNDIMDAELPFSEIEGVFFNNGSEETASVVMRNGDNITGKHTWPRVVSFETPWGDETIELDDVVSITRNRSVRLVPSGVDNPRWIIQQEIRSEN